MKRISELLAVAALATLPFTVQASDELRSTAMNQKLSNQERMAAIRQLYPEQFAENNGVPSRTIVSSSILF